MKHNIVCTKMCNTVSKRKKIFRNWNVCIDVDEIIQGPPLRNETAGSDVAQMPFENYHEL